MFIPERKLSHSRDTQGNLIGLDFAADDGPDSISREWIYSRWAKIIMRVAALVSLISVSMNTPATFKEVPSLMYVTLILDCAVALVFTVEMVSKMFIEGLFVSTTSQVAGGGHDAKRKKSYFQRFWNCFDATMLLCIYASLGLQGVEFYITMQCPAGQMSCHVSEDFWRKYGSLAIIRCPRPLILIRVFRAVLRLQLPKARVKAIFQRSTHQTYNVTMFLLFFMSLYGFLGVQFFGDNLNYHCVVKTANESNITKRDLAIPDAYCDPTGDRKDADKQCPRDMKCVRIVTSIEDDGGYAGFESFHISIFTVYQAASQEGWVFIMYRAMDCLAPWKGVIYFLSMIFFVAWLVKNVFIAVLIETFAEIRVQFQQMWSPRHTADADSSKIVLKSTGFNVVIMVLVLANAITAAALHFNHNTIRDPSASHLSQLDGFYYAELVFTALFNLEALFKIWCLGWSSYWYRSLFKFELFLCVGTTIHCIPVLYRTEFTYLAVLRTVRLIKASPMLEDFCFKIFGPAKKLGSLILFTTCFLVITSTFSLQLFSSFQAMDSSFDRFSTFPKAFASMFQILTQKGWVAVMHDTMDVVTNRGVITGVAVYFVFYHLVVTLIVLSLFVAVILDNLELDEDIKKLKQLKLREISAETQQKLPLRLRVFEKFPNRPQMIQLTRLVSDFLMPKIRDSFMRQFAAVSALEEVEDETIEEMLSSMTRQTQPTEPRRSVASRIKGFFEPAPSSAQLETIRAIKRKVHGLHGQEKVRAIIYLLKSMRHRTGNALGASKSYRANGEIRTTAGRADTREHESRTKSGDGSSRVDIKLLQQKAQMAEIKRTQQEVELRENHPFFDRPLFALGRDNRLRHLCLLVVEARHKGGESSDSSDNGSAFHKLLGHVPYLDWAAIIVTILSCASMSVETPQARLMNTPKVQISLIFVSYMMRVETIGPESGEHILMVLRCLRPLRIFCLVPQMRRVVYELVRGFREILMVSVLLVVFMFIFAVYGVHLFGGRLAICNDRTITTKEKCVGRFHREISVTKLKSIKGPGPRLLVPRVWANPRNFNFDNIGNAMLALFEVLSLEGWVEIRDVINERIGPRHTIYIHLFVFIGCLIGLTLFVGVVIANYSENKKIMQRNSQTVFSTQAVTFTLQYMMLFSLFRLELRQEPGQDGYSANPMTNNLEKKSVKFRCLIYDITQHIAFKRASAILVVANCGLLFFPFNETDLERDSNVHKRYLAQVSLGIIFTLFFCLECLLKIIALGFKGYWQSRRNRFDMLVAILGCTWIILHFILRPNPVTLKMLMLTVIMSMYKSLFIITSMFLLMIVYALAGVTLFGSVKYGDNLGRHANFHNAFRATALLTRIVTGEDWNKIMHDCMIQPPFCRMRPNFWETDCGNFRAALIYFCSFYVIITYVMLNVLVAIIMENFSLFYSNDEDAIMSYNDIRNFQLAWNVIDVNRKGVIKASYVRFLLRLIPRERVGFDLSKKKDQQLFKEMCYEVETLRGGREKDVSFHDVLMVLAYRTVDITKTLQLEELIAREELEYAIEEEVARQTIAAWIERCIFRNRQKHGHLNFKMRQMSLSVDETDGTDGVSQRVQQMTPTGKKASVISNTLKARRESSRAMEQPFGASNERAHMINAPMLTPTANLQHSGRRLRKSVSTNKDECLALLEAEEGELDMEPLGEYAIPPQPLATPQVTTEKQPNSHFKASALIPNSLAGGRSAKINTLGKPGRHTLVPTFVDTCENKGALARVDQADDKALASSNKSTTENYITEQHYTNLSDEDTMISDGRRSKTNSDKKVQITKSRRSVPGYSRVAHLPDVVEDSNEPSELQLVYTCSNVKAENEVVNLTEDWETLSPSATTFDTASSRSQTEERKRQKVSIDEGAKSQLGANVASARADLTVMVPSKPWGDSSTAENQSPVKFCEDVKNWWRNQLHSGPLKLPSAAPSSYAADSVSGKDDALQSLTTAYTRQKPTISRITSNLPGKRRSGAALAIMRRNQTIRSSNLIGTSIDEDVDGDNYFAESEQDELKQSKTTMAL
ncbi:transporter, cation channel family protein [Opisthorchis viverrini]|uniref:Transporter, cation channel family protein n=1 Tax=Opisthorchis viverrini TaxID=6198 RepID=A0A1S8X951_OPIVI|nr:transporter, cation channel family protein [Opisthorchis viverrini]